MHRGRFPDWMWPYVDELRVCEMYHCTPEEADEVDFHRAKRHQAIKAAEGKYHQYESKSRARLNRLRGRSRGR